VPEKARCGHCLHITGKGKTACYHSMTAAVIARPGGDMVLPPAPELIRNEAGPGDEGKSPASGSYEGQKQDCERKAAKRLLEKHGEYYKTLQAMPLGDDLYAGRNTREAVLDSELSFLFTREDESPPDCGTGQAE
jgi:hypothetical protein